MTYPEMNDEIVEILRSFSDPSIHYAASRIEELERQLDQVADALKAVAPYVGNYHENLAKIVGDYYDQNPRNGILEALGFFTNLEKSHELREQVALAIAAMEDNDVAR